VAREQTLLGYLKGPKPAIFYELGPYFCAAALAISCVIQLSAINNGLKAEGALVRCHQCRERSVQKFDL
jgi:hypothetical protein